MERETMERGSRESRRGFCTLGGEAQRPHYIHLKGDVNELDNSHHKVALGKRPTLA